ncbi:MAG: Rrf2 family transcriptional regulator [Clostridia bacterium]|nr:Rrf2 family transcriptional regulator [Clostridia bacterium]
MKLSTKGRYGIHAMYDLAQYGSETPQPIKSIAERQNIPEAYLEQLIGQLRRSGLVKSVRGAQGGYLLSRTPAEITVGEVLRTLEGELAVVDCLMEEDLCHKACSCPTRVVWKKLRDGLNEIVDGITLQDMLDDYQRMSAEGRTE